MSTHDPIPPDVSDRNRVMKRQSELLLKQTNESYGLTTNQKGHCCDPSPAVNVPIQFVCAVHWTTVNVKKTDPPWICVGHSPLEFEGDE